MKRFLVSIVFTNILFGQGPIQFDGNVIIESMSNISGGINPGKVMSGVGELGFEYSLKNSLLRASTLAIYGESPSDFIGDGFGASNIDGYDSFRLYEIWVEHEWKAHGINLRVGSLLADAEFSVNDVGGLFVNSSFGWPAYISGNTINTGPAYFVTAPGIRLQYALGDNQFLRFGIYDGDSFDDISGDGEKTKYGMNWNIGNDQGIFSIGEFVSSGGENNSPYILKIGSWRYTCSDTVSLYYQETPNQYGYYISTEFGLMNSQIKTPILGFLRAGWSPNSLPNTYTLALDGGITIKNISQKLTEDMLGIGIAYAKIADQVFVFNAEEMVLIPMDYECAIELTYQFQLLDHFTIQPDFQWILHPGGSPLTEDAFVGSIRISYSF